MAVVENAGVELGSNRNIETPLVEPSNGSANNEQEQSQVRHSSLQQNTNGSILKPHPHDRSLYGGVVPSKAHVNSGQKGTPQVVVQRSFDHSGKIGDQKLQVGPARHQRSNGGDLQRNGDHIVGENFNRDMKDLSELFSKLNPMAEEFVPPSLANNHGLSAGFLPDNKFLPIDDKNNNGNINGHTGGRIEQLLMGVSSEE